MEKATSNLTFDVKYADGSRKEVETGILMEVKPDGKHIICHLGTSNANHIFAFIDALKEVVHETGLDDLYKKYRAEKALKRMEVQNGKYY